MKTNKKIYEKRIGFRLLLEPALHSEIEARSQQRHISMTAYITRAIIKLINHERMYDEKGEGK